MLSEKLKQQTLTSHQALEKVLVTQMKGLRKAEDYITLLGLFYSYFGALEDRISLFIGPAELPDYLRRRKTASLASDMQALGGVLPAKVSQAQIPVIENSLQAFGALYVIEGSTLGGRIITQMIAKHLGLTHGMSFFEGYGDETGVMWASFKLTLNHQAKNEEEEKLLICAAEETFTNFRRLFN